MGTKCSSKIFVQNCATYYIFVKYLHSLAINEFTLENVLIYFIYIHTFREIMIYDLKISILKNNIYIDGDNDGRS